MDRKAINKWWSARKEKLAHTNSGKGHKGDKFSVPTDFSHFVPLPGQTVKRK